jgi:hypothetical protein
MWVRDDDRDVLVTVQDTMVFRGTWVIEHLLHGTLDAGGAAEALEGLAKSGLPVDLVAA